MLALVDPPRKRVDKRPVSADTASASLALGQICEGSPALPRRALTVHRMYVKSLRRVENVSLELNPELSSPLI